MVNLFRFLFVISFSFSSVAETVGIRAYVKEFIEEDYSHIQAVYEYNKSLFSSEVAGDLSATTFGVTPYYQHSETSYEIASTDQSSYSSGGGASLSQQFSSGSELTLSAQQLWLEDPTSSNQIHQDYQLEISQDLLKNFMGKQDRMKLNSAKFLVESKKEDLQNQRNESCKVAMTLYIDGYISQEKLKIREQIYNKSTEILRVSRNLFRRRLIKKIEKLSSETDHLSNQGLFLQEKENVRFINTKLFRHRLDNGKGVGFEPPDAEMKGFGVNSSKLEISSLPIVRGLQSDLLAKKELEKFYNREKYGVLDFGLKVGKLQGDGVSGGSASEYGQEYSRVSLEFTFPLSNDSILANSKSALADQRWLEFRIHDLQRELRLQFAQQTNEEKLYSSLKKISRDKLKLYTGQQIEADRLYRAGRIEFSDYAFYRDLYLTEEMHNLDLRKQGWVNLIKLYFLTKSQHPICGDYI